VTFVAGNCWYSIAGFLYAFEFWTAAAAFSRGWNLGHFLAITTSWNWILGTSFALDLAMLTSYVTLGTEYVFAHFDLILARLLNFNFWTSWLVLATFLVRVNTIFANVQFIFARTTHALPAGALGVTFYQLGYFVFGTCGFGSQRRAALAFCYDRVLVHILESPENSCLTNVQLLESRFIGVYLVKRSRSSDRRIQITFFHGFFSCILLNAEAARISQGISNFNVFSFVDAASFTLMCAMAIFIADHTRRTWFLDTSFNANVRFLITFCVIDFTIVSVQTAFWRTQRNARIVAWAFRGGVLR